MLPLLSLLLLSPHGALPSLIADAVEDRGPAALPILRAAPAWAAAAGFDPPELLEAALGAPLPVGSVGSLRAASARGAWAEAQRHAIRLAVAGHQDRLILGALDRLAQVRLREGRLWAAEAALLLAAPSGNVASRFEERVARLYRAKATRAASLEAAAGWLRVSYFIAHLDLDRAALADTLADAAAWRLSREDLEGARELLREARAVDPSRLKVQALRDLDPQLSGRGRAGVILIIIGLGFFASRRLRGLFRRREAWERDDLA